MIPGPKPKPGTIKLMSGERHRDRINPNEPKSPVGRPKRPPDLNHHERQAWDSLLDCLETLRLISSVDRQAYLEYARTYGEYMMLRDKITRDGWTVRAKEGVLKRHPNVPTLLQLKRELRHWWEQFGLTPSARARLSVERTPVEQSQGAAKYLT